MNIGVQLLFFAQNALKLSDFKGKRRRNSGVVRGAFRKKMAVSNRKKRTREPNKRAMLRCLRLAYPDKSAQRRLAYPIYLISERIKKSRIQVPTLLSPGKIHLPGFFCLSKMS